MIQKKGKIQYGTITIPYYIIKSKRVKTSEIIVESDKVTIRTPLNKNLSEIRRIVSDKASWILKKQKEYKEAIPTILKPTFVEGSTLPYLGRNYPLRILKEKEPGHNSIEFVDGQFITKMKSSKESTINYAIMIKKLYEGWLIEEAQSLFKRKVERYSEKLVVKPKKIIIKNLKKRWGSMTKGGSINLNVNLLKASEDVIDYIILHELCHLKIKEHSHHYWDLVHRHMPDYQEKIDWLNVNWTMLV